MRTLQAQAPDRKPDATSKLGILVVDDNHLVRALLQLGLERSGFDVWVSSNGRDAIDVYQKERDGIALVLLDVQMPDLDGPATLDRLRELNSEVVVCFMSGNTWPYTSDDLVRRGGALVIAKPFTVHGLVEILRQVASPA